MAGGESGAAPRYLESPVSSEVSQHTPVHHDLDKKRNTLCAYVYVCLNLCVFPMQSRQPSAPRPKQDVPQLPGAPILSSLEPPKGPSHTG